MVLTCLYDPSLPLSLWHALQVQKSRLEVAKANAAAIERKQQAKLAGRKEIEDMLLYQAMKDTELQKREVRATCGRRDWASWVGVYQLPH